MLELAKRSNEDRRAIFAATTLRVGMNEAIIEKDFWVCWMLDILFHKSDYSESLSFKGGTSLSKGYNIIKRFSEDIDLILDWRILGYKLDEPWIERSNTAQVKFNKAINLKTAIFLRDELMPHLYKLSKMNGIKDYQFYIDENDKQTIRFVYPQIFKDSALVQEIRLEIGSLAAWTPLTDKTITPYVAENFPDVFSKKSTLVRTVEAKRTFWEKATILHSEAFRRNKSIPERYSRHYYDLYLLYNSSIKDEAFKDLDLLENVAKFKQKFYKSNRAQYELANREHLELLPPEESLKDLYSDYDNMKSMIFGEYIVFDEILNGLSNMVDEIRKIEDYD